MTISGIPAITPLGPLAGQSVRGSTAYPGARREARRLRLIPAATSCGARRGDARGGGPGTGRRGDRRYPPADPPPHPPPPPRAPAPGGPLRGEPQGAADDALPFVAVARRRVGQVLPRHDED